MTPQIVAQDDKHKSRSCVFVFGSSEWGFVGFDWVRWRISELAVDMEYSHLDDVPFQVRQRMLQSPAPSHYSIVTNSPSHLLLSLITNRQKWIACSPLPACDAAHVTPSSCIRGPSGFAFSPRTRRQHRTMSEGETSVAQQEKPTLVVEVLCSDLSAAVPP